MVPRTIYFLFLFYRNLSHTQRVLSILLHRKYMFRHVKTVRITTWLLQRFGNSTPILIFWQFVTYPRGCMLTHVVSRTRKVIYTHIIITTTPKYILHVRHDETKRRQILFLYYKYLCKYKPYFSRSINVYLQIYTTVKNDENMVCKPIVNGTPDLKVKI